MFHTLDKASALGSMGGMGSLGSLAVTVSEAVLLLWKHKREESHLEGG